MNIIKITFILICLFTSINSFGQLKYERLFKKEKFGKVERKLSKDVEKNPDDVFLTYTLSVLYFQREFKKYNCEKAYDYILKAKKIYNSASHDETEKYNKKGVTIDLFKITIDSITNNALEDVATKNTVSDYNHFLSKFREAPAKYKREATSLRNTCAYNDACSINTVKSFQTFIDKYPKSDQYSSAISKRNSLAFKEAELKDNVSAYKAFIAKYPKAKQVKSANERIHELEYDYAKSINTSESYYNFINEYPNSKQYNTAFEKYEKLKYEESIIPGNWKSYESFIHRNPNNSWVSSALDSMWNIAVDERQIKQLQYCVHHLSGADKNKALLLLHDVFTDDGEISTLDVFYSNFDVPLLYDNKIQDYALAKAGDELLLHLPYDSKNSKKYDEYIKLAAPNERSYVALQRLISSDIKYKNWYNALKTVKTYQSYFGDDNKKIIDLIHLLEAEWDYTIKIYSLGTFVNSKTGGELSPVISIDGRELYFCGKNRVDNIGGEDIFKTEKRNGYWTKAELVEGLSSAESNDAPLSISADGNKILLFKSGKIYYSEKSSYGWSYAKPFSNIINASEWQSDAMITSDGKSLIFTSSGLSGENIYLLNPYNYHGDNLHPSDIYVSHLNDFGNWSEPINIGNVINTPYSERTPFLHPDMKTLYFSSDGHGGFGKLDVFKSTRLNDTCWNCWSEPINMGKEFNTSDSDMGYKISTSGDVAYFSYEQKSDQQTSVLFLLDVSGSMYGDKLEALQIAAVQSCQNAIINNSEVSIMAFAGDCTNPIVSTLDFTKDINEVIYSISDLDADGNTPLYESLTDACEYLWTNSSVSSTNKVIILMSDGDDNGCTTLDKTLNNLKYRGLLYRIQCIAFDVNQYSKAYEDLQKIADDSKGQFYYAESISDLNVTFEKAGNDIFNIHKSNVNTDIMVCNLPNHLKPDFVATISGKIIDKNNQPVYAEIKWEDLETGNNVGQSKSDPIDGSFYIVLPLGKIYGYYVDSDEYFPISNNIDLRKNNVAVEIVEDIDMVSFKQMIEDGDAVPVNNLFFNFGQYDLLPYSLPELKRVADIIKSNGLYVEISGHTDNVGTQEDNQELSVERAIAVKDFLISEGCDGSKLSTVGYGDTKPVATNDTDKGRAKNRRVELRFVQGP